MRSILILIDNESKPLAIMKQLVIGNENFNGMEIQTLCKESTESLNSIVERINELIPKDEEKQAEQNFHIVIDACLTDEEHNLEVIDESFSGIRCLREIDELLQNTKCKYKLSLMSRFFAKQLEKSKIINKNKINNFYTIIRKPFLDSGEVDKGFSPMTQYVNILPEHLLTKEYTTAFANIVIYALQGDKK